MCGVGFALPDDVPPWTCGSAANLGRSPEVWSEPCPMRLSLTAHRRGRAAIIQTARLGVIPVGEPSDDLHRAATRHITGYQLVFRSLLSPINLRLFFVKAIEEQKTLSKHPFKLIVACIASLYFLWCAWSMEWHFIDGVNLLIHEAGHVVFKPFGELLMIAGGSLFQILLPAIFVGYFVWNKKFFSAALVLFWVGESLLYVAIYAGDSLALQLPLVGGEIHDWNYILGQFGMLKQTAKIAGLIRFLGTLTIIAAAIGSIKASLTEEAREVLTYAQPGSEWRNK